MSTKPKKMPEDSEICKFYHGQNVFITGATGFVGHVLIEKLLRSTDVATIYVLIREKKGKSVQERLDQVLNCVLFDRLRSERPNFREQVVPLSGDCGLEGLGLSHNDRLKLASEVNIVFHGAATVRFDENLKHAFGINVDGTVEVLQLCKEMKDLKSVVYVSTAYANCYEDTVEEKFYDCPVNIEEVKTQLENVTKEEADQITPKILEYWPNTYTFTKALTESLIRKTAGDLPIGIYRPSIILPTSKEPIKGWTNNFYGPTGAIIGAAFGVVHIYPCNDTLITDIVPVDTCVAGLVAVAWDIGNRNASEIFIYNCVSSVENALTWGDYNTLNVMHGSPYPPTKGVYALTIYHVPVGPKYYILRPFLNTFPAIIIDTVLVLSGRKPRMKALMDKIHKFSDAVSFFANREWTFKNDNFQELWDKMNRTDKKLFPLSMQTVSWTMYFRDHFKWVRLYLLGDPLETLDAARVRYGYLYKIHQGVKLLGIFILVTLVWVILLSKI